MEHIHTCGHTDTHMDTDTWNTYTYVDTQTCTWTQTHMDTDVEPQTHMDTDTWNTYTHVDTQTHTWTQTHMDTDIEPQAHMDTDTWNHLHIHGHTDTWTHRDTDTQNHGHTETHRTTDTHGHRHKHGHRHMESQTHMWAHRHTHGHVILLFLSGGWGRLGEGFTHICTHQEKQHPTGLSKHWVSCLSDVDNCAISTGPWILFVIKYRPAPSHRCTHKLAPTPNLEMPRTPDSGPRLSIVHDLALGMLAKCGDVCGPTRAGVLPAPSRPRPGCSQHRDEPPIPPDLPWPHSSRGGASMVAKTARPRTSRWAV